MSEDAAPKQNFFVGLLILVAVFIGVLVIKLVKYVLRQWKLRKTRKSPVVEVLDAPVV